ncbi:hypothetical protein [Streptomyces gilvosporeus]|uniref:DUF4232 domain-containing protein n=1 Tax=Streptomyces gilvosporeus TaxID=553510 RepID=A0A1V0TUE3_9ACTN|nr:hypothetical protein [Streptomyces gilvosporeus]ARF56312.1 hypothetical protein B1H19_20925 [Streptomyces gilvosporeus]
MTAGRSRHYRAAYAALALGLAGSLALTGCKNHSSKKSKTSSSSSSSYKSKKHRIIGRGTGAGAMTSRRRGMCRPTPGSFTFVQLSAPSHVLVKYRNKSRLSCYLYNAPMVYRGDAPSKSGSYDITKPLGLYGGSPGFMNSHRIEVRGGATAYASIPTPTPSDKGKAQNVMYLGVMMQGKAAMQGVANAVHFGRYDRHPSIGATAKVGDWYLTRFRAESATHTSPSR